MKVLFFTLGWIGLVLNTNAAVSELQNSLLIQPETISEQKIMTAQRQKALAEYEDFRSENSELADLSFEAIEELKQEVKHNKNLKKLIKEARKNEASQVELENAFVQHFDRKGIRFGLVRTGYFSAANLLVGGFGVNASSGGSDYGFGHMEIGPGLGWSTGVGVLGCLLQGEGVNIGIGARAVVGAGAQVGTYVGRNGVCVVLAGAVGLNVSVGLGALAIYE
jgi:hypothetical protein